jgi:hypothetical protein
MDIEKIPTILALGLLVLYPTLSVQTMGPTIFIKGIKILNYLSYSKTTKKSKI